MHIISVTDFPLSYLNSARKCLILPAECSPHKLLILLEILEFIQASPPNRKSMLELNTKKFKRRDKQRGYHVTKFQTAGLLLLSWFC